jgi:uncharacterized membrane protein YkvA (DUF1232 family)
MRPAYRPSLRDHARALKNETLAVYLACRDPRVPWYAKALGVLIVGYALSPIDLIPDSIPVLGYLDDLILIPLGIALLLRMIPAHARARFKAGAPRSRIAAVVVAAIWIGLLALFVWLILRAVSRR